MYNVFVLVTVSHDGRKRNVYIEFKYSKVDKL